MELVNKSRLPLEVTTALDKGGKEHLLLVAKATYRFGEGRRMPERVEESLPIAYADTFIGEPGLSSPLYEADMAMTKRWCDVLVDATAHAPEGRPVKELEVAVRVGTFEKQFLVVGDRVWQQGLLRVSASTPEPFTSMRIHYGRAFGGSPKLSSKEGQETYLSNPVGRGYCPDPRAHIVDQMPLPNTEDAGQRVTSPSAQVQPLSLGPIGRSWNPRSAYAGTYDARWREHVFPLLPEDFDEAFFQAAPPDQQIDFIRGGEPVVLRNLVPGEPHVTFKLPRPELVVRLLYASHRTIELSPVVDTVFLEPDAKRFTMVYRTALPLDRRGLFGISLMAAGPVCKRWWESKVLGTEDCGCGGDSSKDETPASLMDMEELEP
ncbi:DUF2169 family type VI secretion system accessory protein [Hyalangium minutum]|uniref:DUF2169 domain-containing protein n=1 Tax=Hyalangium minutum TaxID=394096 RepID=A0A085WIT5_9BACT|nr:DUF2169 domain-containing protein [Hyalangium minutum]KFE67598.1 hypothetical protein DB31_8081 [Hyalangium minutum]